MSALDTQVGGDHYKSAKIQPVVYIEANKLQFLEGCVVKRCTRHDKPTGKGRQDIEKAIHELQLLLELRYPVHRGGFVGNTAYRVGEGPSELHEGFTKWDNESDDRIYPVLGNKDVTVVLAKGGTVTGRCSGMPWAEVVAYREL